MRVWLHKGEGGEWGWNAWSLDHLGFATWAPSRSEVLARAPRKLDEYRRWLTGEGLSLVVDPSSAVQVVEEISGDEPAFQDDLLAADVDEISLCRHLLRLTRHDLLAVVKDLGDAALDWDPPYRHFAPWARWRTIRQILEHVAFTEIGYYLPNVGWRVELNPAELESAPWPELLRRTREETMRFLEGLQGSADRVRLTETRTDGIWTVRKVLRRLVWHERLHSKSIRRIVRLYQERAAAVPKTERT